MANTAFFKKHAYESGGVQSASGLQGGYTSRYRNITTSAILAKDGSTLLAAQTYKCTDYGDGYNKGYEAGYADGKDKGYDLGYSDGFADARGA